MRHIPLALLALLATGLTGCASVLNDARQDIKVQTRLADGQVVADAQCTLRNERETVQAPSEGTVSVRRSGDDLFIRCEHPSHPAANARAVSRANKEMAGNAFFLFGMGAALDHKLGKGYTYPGWVEPVFGQDLVFDRKDEKDGQPVPGRVDDSQAAQKSASEKSATGAPENRQAAPAKPSASTAPATAAAPATPAAAAASSPAAANTREAR